MSRAVRSHAQAPQQMIIQTKTSSVEIKRILFEKPQSSQHRKRYTVIICYFLSFGISFKTAQIFTFHVIFLLGNCLYIFESQDHH